MCRRGGALFRVNCGDDGYPKKCSGFDCPKTERDNSEPNERDLSRAKQTVPAHPFTGANAPHTWSVLNQHLKGRYGLSRPCSEWTAAEIQALQVILLMQSHGSLDAVYQDADDKRRLKHKNMDDLSKEWLELNQVVDRSPRMAEMHKAGFCAEAVMWFVHHLAESVRDSLSEDDFHVPLLHEEHHTCPPDANEEELKVCAKYNEQVSCATCHGKPKKMQKQPRGNPLYTAEI